MTSAVNTLEASFVKLNPELAPIFQDLTLQLDYGKVVCVTGENGCGKTILSYLVGRFAPFLVLHRLTSDLRYDFNGTMNRKDAEKYWSQLSYTFQDPDSQYSELRVKHELNRTIPDRKQSKSLINRYNLTSLLNRGFSEMSYGERQRALWARDFGLNREVYILDEVGCYLDDYWQEILAEDIRKLRDRGKTICLFGHPGERLKLEVDDWYSIDKGKLLIGKPSQGTINKLVEQRDWPKGKILLHVQPFMKKVSKRQRIVRCPEELQLCQGDIGVIDGSNGSGKTSLVLAICGLIGRKYKSIKYTANIRPLLVMQNPYSQTVDANVGLMLQGIPSDHLSESFPWLRKLDFKRDPLSLSYGEQKVIHILRALYSNSPLVVVDELATGLSEQTTSLLCAQISSTCRECGKAVLLTSHPGINLPLPVSVGVSL